MNPDRETRRQGDKETEKRAVFLDRDGVLNRTYLRDGVTRPPAHVGAFEFLPGVPEAVRKLAEAGFVLVVVTNQPDVSRGLLKQENVEAIHDHLRLTLPLHEVLACYHDNADGCACRKPKPGMLLEAAQRWPIDLGRSFMVGDRCTDVLAGQAAGCRTVLIDTPYSERDRCAPDFSAPDLTEAVAWILSRRED